MFTVELDKDQFRQLLHSLDGIEHAVQLVLAEQEDILKTEKAMLEQLKILAAGQGPRTLVLTLGKAVPQ
jgi:uracil DNA glycosylase